MLFLNACGLSARRGRQYTGLLLINGKGALDGSSGKGRVRPIHRHRYPSVGFHVLRNGGLSHRIVWGITTTHRGVRKESHSGRRGKGLSLVHVLMPPSHREVGDGDVRPMHPGEWVEIQWSVRRNNGLTHKPRIGWQLSVIGWGGKTSCRSSRTACPT